MLRKRSDLGVLCKWSGPSGKWPGPAHRWAKSVETAINGIMEFLPRDDLKSPFKWPMGVVVYGRKRRFG